MKKIIVICVAIILVCTTMMSGFSISSSAKVQENPKNRVGLWWWNTDLAYQQAKRDSYLNFYETMGITEIYFYDCSKLISSDLSRKTLHGFIEEANRHHMKVAFLYDNAGICDETDHKNLIRLRDSYVTYRNTYPNDDIYGIHFDIEGFSSFENYIANFIGAVSILRDEGIEVGVDVNCAWDRKDLELDGINGFYEIMATHIDYLTLMSYRTTPENILNFGKIGLDICKKYHCDCLLGAEAGDTKAGENVDFSSKSIGYMMNQVRKTLSLMDEQGLDMEYGIALHHASAMYNLPGSLPGPYITADDYDPEEVKKDHPIEKKTIYKNDNVNLELAVTSKESIYIDIPEIADALHKDYAENGALRGDFGEYYEITIHLSSYRTTDVHPYLYDASNQFSFWSGTTYEYDTDCPNGTKIQEDEDTVAVVKIHDMFDVKSNQYGQFTNECDGLLLYILGRSTSLSISGIQIDAYRETKEKIYLGDVNRDNALDMKDILLIRKYLAHMKNDVFYEAFADANYDGKIDLKDVLFLRYVLIGNKQPIVA